MKKKESYVKIYRSLLDHELWWGEPFTRGQAWVDLICLANFGTTKTFFRGELQVVERGQIKASYGFFQDRWRWSRNRVIHFFKQLQVLQMVSVSSTNNGTTITLENYASFQDGGIAKGIAEGTTKGKTEGTTEGIQNKKNIKRIIKKENDSDSNSKMPQGKIVKNDDGYEYFVPSKEVV